MFQKLNGLSLHMYMIENDHLFINVVFNITFVHYDVFYFVKDSSYTMTNDEIFNVCCCSERD